MIKVDLHDEFNSHLTRQSEIIPTDKIKDTRISLIGCGAIGSFLALQAAKMGVTYIEMYDHDTVSVENMSNQFYRFSDIDRFKVDALHDLINDFTGVKPFALHKKFDMDDKIRGHIVLSCVDDMEARKVVLERAFASEHTTHLVDTRMAAEYSALYVVNLRDYKSIEAYKKTLYSNSEAVQERCTAKSTIYTVSLISGLACKAIKNIVCEESYTKQIQWDISKNENSMVSFEERRTK